MRFVLSLFFSIFFISVFGQEKNLVTERIIYTVRFDDGSGKDKGHYQHLDSLVKSKLINDICDLLYEGKLATCNCWGIKVSEMPLLFSCNKWTHYLGFHRNNSLAQTLDTQNLKNKSDSSHYVGIYRELLNSLSFLEKWYYDEKTNRFSKVVNGALLFQDRAPKYKSSFINYTPFNDSSNNIYAEKNLVVEDIIYDVEISRNEQNKTEEFNWWHNFLEASKREWFFTKLTDKARTDSIKSFNPNFPFDTIFTESSGNVYHGRTHALMAGHHFEFGGTAASLLSDFVELSDWRTIRKLRFHEDWYFDPIALRFEKKVLGIGMIVDTYNKQGKVNGEKCLVYYKLTP